MSKVKIQGNASGTGVVTLTAPNTNTDRTITLPDGTQTLIGADASGNVTVSTGNLVIGTSGKGIDFSADGNAAGMTSEVLDDYETGTFTPTIIRATTPNTLTYNFQYGNYTKIGRMVHVTGSMHINTPTVNGTGQIQIRGLPFSAGISGTAAYGMGGNLTYNSALPGTADYKTIKMYASNGFTIESSTDQDTGELSGNLEAGYIAFTAVYYTA